MPSSRMTFSLLSALTVFACTLPISGHAQVMGAEPPPLPTGSRAPAFATTTLQGKPLSLASLRGKVVLLDYWATWCGPCRMATPALQSLHKQFARQGLRVVGLSVDQADSLAQVKPFVKAFGMTYLVSASPALNGRAARAYHVNGIPSQYLIDKKGIVRWSQSGYSEGERQELAARIRTLLAEK
jgi:thiol-disulfide isomerase/thioredoxin